MNTHRSAPPSPSPPLWMALLFTIFVAGDSLFDELFRYLLTQPPTGYAARAPADPRQPGLRARGRASAGWSIASKVRTTGALCPSLALMAAHSATFEIMGFLDDLAGAHRAASEWLDGALTTARRWAASEDGQLTLLSLDYLAISSKVGDFYEHTGWYLPVHPALLRYAVEHVETQAPFDARRAARLVGPGSEHWGWITEGVMATPTLATRRPVVADAIDCLEHERWYAAVSTLLPVIEGIVSDRSGILKDMRVGRRLDQILHRQTGPLDALSAIPALDVVDKEIFHGRDFAATAPADDALNRHLVLHGRTVGFGTPINAVRTFMIVTALAELFDGALVFRSASSPVDEGSLLDEYGPLAEMRSAARRWALKHSDG